MLCSWTGRLKVRTYSKDVNFPNLSLDLMQFWSKFQYFFGRYVNSKIYMESWKNQTSQNKKESWKIHSLPNFKIIKSSVIKTGMLLERGKSHRSVEEMRKSRHRPTKIWSLIFGLRCNEKRVVFQQMMGMSMGIYRQKMNLDLNFFSILITDLNIRH